MVIIELLILVILFAFLCAYKNVNIKRRDFIIISIIFTLLIIYLASIFETGWAVSEENYIVAPWDLTRYHFEISALKGYTFKEIIPMMMSATEPLRIAIFYFLSFSNNLQLLSMISTALPMVLLIFLIVKNHSYKKIGMRYIFLCYLICFCGIDFMDMVVTCRYVIAVTIFVLGLYILFTESGILKILFAFVLMIISSLLHNFFWLFFGVAVVCYLFPKVIKSRWKCLVLFWQFFLSFFVLILEKIPIDLMDALAKKINRFMDLGLSLSFNRVMFYVVSAMAGVTLLLFLSKTRGEGERENILLDVIRIFTYLWIGGVGSYASNRIMFIISLLSPIYLKRIEEGSKNKKLYIQIFIMCCLFLMIYHIAVNMIYFKASGAYFHW